MYKNSLNDLVKKMGKTGQPVSVLASGEKMLPQENQGDQKAKDLLVKHPMMSASTFYNLMKSKGLKIIQESNRLKEGGPGSGRYPAGSGKLQGINANKARAIVDVLKMNYDNLSKKDLKKLASIAKDAKSKGAHHYAGLLQSVIRDNEIKSRKKTKESSSELPMGIKDELEHTPDKKVAKKIAQDHLAKDPHYYSKLKKAGLMDAIECMGKRFKACGSGMKQADSASANMPALRARESSPFHIDTRFMEGAARDNGVGHTRFRVVIIQEGLGNIKDSFFYSSDALKSAVPVFEGKKIYADHPTSAEEATRPERSVKDVLGHFENVEYIEKEGRGQLEADVVILPDEPYRWARALMRHSVEYAKKYPDKDFVGLSINASGEADPVRLTEMLSNVALSSDMRVKLEKAAAEGIETVRVVKSINKAVSCDLVTEAGAGGKVLEMLETDTKGDKSEKRKIS